MKGVAVLVGLALVASGADAASTPGRKLLKVETCGLGTSRTVFLEDLSCTYVGGKIFRPDCQSEDALVSVIAGDAQESIYTSAGATACLASNASVEIPSNETTCSQGVTIDKCVTSNSFAKVQLNFQSADGTCGNVGTTGGDGIVTVPSSECSTTSTGSVKATCNSDGSKNVQIFTSLDCTGTKSENAVASDKSCFTALLSSQSLDASIECFAFQGSLYQDSGNAAVSKTVSVVLALAVSALALF